VLGRWAGVVCGRMAGIVLGRPGDFRHASPIIRRPARRRTKPPRPARRRLLHLSATTSAPHQTPC